MGRPRRALRDPNLAVGVVEQGYRVGMICIVPVFRQNPLTVDPVFWLAYNPVHIEDAVSPYETDEQCLFVAQARNFGMKVASTPNGGYRETQTAVKMKREGMVTGFPDVTVIRGIPESMSGAWEAAKSKRMLHPKTWDEAFKQVWQQWPVAIEFKRRNGQLDDISLDQLSELEELTASGWRTAVSFGSAAAFGYLKHLGYYTPPIK
jgi:hypothetical protein